MFQRLALRLGDLFLIDRRNAPDEPADERDVAHPENGLGRKRAHSDDGHVGRQRAQFGQETGSATVRRPFFVAIGLGFAKSPVRYVRLGAKQFVLRKKGVKQLTALAEERPSLLLFPSSGALANGYQPELAPRDDRRRAYRDPFFGARANPTPGA